MFISKQEKVGILSRIVELEKAVALLSISHTKPASGWTEESRAKHSKRMKKIWADKQTKAVA